MKGIIIYKSTYGSTRQYAQWLSEETGYKSVELKKVKNKDITDCDVVIFGCPVLAYKPSITKWIQKKWHLLKNKKVVLYTTSGTYSEDPKLQEGFESSFKPDIKSKIKYFPQGGRMIAADLKPLHKFLMNLGKKMEKDPKVREEMDKDKDNINRDGIKPILEYVL